MIRGGGGKLAGSAIDAKLAAAHRAFLNEPGLQREFAAAPPPAKTPPWLLKLMDALSQAAPVIKIVFWAGVAIGVALLLWVIIRDLPFAAVFRRRRRPAAAPLDWRPEAEAARALLGDADRLAEEGRFGEAIHLILFRSIDDIVARRPGSVPRALTSREIVEAAPLSERGRDAFRIIADAVERTFFGGRSADRGDFDRCRGEYEAFALAEGAR